MAKPPAWMKISTPYLEGGKAFVNVRVHVRHPAFLWMMWKLFRQEARRQGHNPNSPRMMWVVVYHLVKLAVKGAL